jgi:signal transduction histidine kinase
VILPRHRVAWRDAPAQQRLVSLRIRLAIASEQPAADPGISATLGELQDDLDDAVEELRDLAHGNFPSVLSPTAGSCPRCAPSGVAARARSR